jgi:protease-4
VETSRNADIWSAQHDNDEAEQQHVQAWLDRVYEDFTAKVARGRGMSAAAVEQAAKGRVWTGAQAKALGLVDELGGYRRAIALAREAAGLAPDAPVELVEYPPVPDWLAALRPEPPESSESPVAIGIGLEPAFLEDDLAARLRQVLRAAELAGPGHTLSMPPVGVGP